MRSKISWITILLILLSAMPVLAQYGSPVDVSVVIGEGDFEVYVSTECTNGRPITLNITRDDDLNIIVLVPPGRYTPVNISVVGTSLQLLTDVSDEGEIQFDFPVDSMPEGTYELTINGFVFFEMTLEDPDPGDYRVIYTNLLDDEAQIVGAGIEGAGQVLVDDNDMLNRMVNVSSDGERIAYVADPLAELAGDFEVDDDTVSFGDCVSEVNIQTPADDRGPGGLGPIGERLDGVGNLLMMADSDGENRRTLRDDGEFSDPIWMPDDENVVFVALRNGITDLYMIDVETREETRITDNDDVELSPAVSPDGTYLVYVVDNDGIFELWMISLEDEDAEPEPLLEEEFSNSFPAFSPDGATIAFSSDRNGVDAGIYLYDVESGEIAELVDTDVDEIQPAWSPEGDLIIYSAYNPGNATFDLFVIPLDESYEPINITDDGAWDDVRPQIIQIP